MTRSWSVGRERAAVERRRQKFPADFAALACLWVLCLAGAARAASVCDGDCDDDGRVMVDELVRGVNIALGSTAPETCAAFDVDEDGAVAVHELVGAVNRALTGCPLCVDFNRRRNVYFGDLHVHTALSFDAYGFDVRTTPEQAYRFALGEPLYLPPLDDTGEGTRRVEIDRPLDFVAVTDHAEFLGEIEVCTTPGSPAYDSATCTRYRLGGNDAVGLFGTRLTFPQPRHPEVCGPGGTGCLPYASEVWDRIQRAAEDFDDRTPQCSFTTFVAYEYSGNPGISNRHRNVIFRSEQAAFPVSYVDEPEPQGLWARLKSDCLEAPGDCDALAIPHNSNESNGGMFYVEHPGAQTLEEQRAQAAFRASIEPLVEIYQHKGDSECMNGLSGFVGAPDELCEFEKRRRPPFPDCGDGFGALGVTNNGCVSRNDYLRGVLLSGLKEAERIGINPYPLGVIASTDTHNGTPGAVGEDGFPGHRGTEDDTVPDRLGPGQLTAGGIIYSPGGLAGVWAEENSRSSLFDALRRRETFGTSGPRISVRFFAGWDLPADSCERADMVRTAYASGVPMGGVLPMRPSRSGPPRFLISALRDPGTALRPGTPLQRLQIVKGWVENGEGHFAVFDVAGDPENGASVDLETCAPSGTGFDSLCTVWSDPEFDPAQHAYYYARVVENPSCRWSTHTCNQMPAGERHPSCDDPSVPKTIQERAWTSPIWHRPRQ